jgi:His-Xaa-Ser repeat protein HxsA
MLIMRVQTALMMRGYDPGAVDGTLGGKTKDALMLFQTESGLASTGRLDARTLASLGITTE